MIFKKLKIKFQNKLLKPVKKRGTSPIIAVLLMVGLTVISGAALFTLSNSLLSAETAVNLDIDDESTVFSSTETDYRFADNLIDTLRIQIENPLEDPILVDLSQTFLINATDDSRLDKWAVVTDVSEIVLNGRESTAITFGTVSSDNSGELSEGDDIYVKFQSKLFGSQNDLSELQSKTFTVELTNSEPLFQLIPVISGSQTLDSLIFAGESDEEVAQTLTFALFNFGNPSESHEKSISITLENDTIFTVANGFETQFVTVPSASQSGDSGAQGFCEVGEACVNITFPITKHNLTEVGIPALSTDIFGALITVSGLEFTSFNLVLQNPEWKIELQNSFLTGVSYNTITFGGGLLGGLFGGIDEDATVSFDVRVWNLKDYENNGTFEIFDFNTTVFKLEPAGQQPIIGTLDANPVDKSFEAGPSQVFSNCRSNDACEEIDWALTRKPLVDSDGVGLGIEAGTYTAKIRETRTGQTMEIALVIPEYMRPIHVERMETSTQGNNLDIDIEIRDSEGNTVWFAEVTITHIFPNGQTETLTDYTNIRGEASFRIRNPSNGLHTFIVEDVEKRTGWIIGSQALWPYDESANLVTSIGVNV